MTPILSVALAVLQLSAAQPSAVNRVYKTPGVTITETPAMAKLNRKLPPNPAWEKDFTVEVDEFDGLERATKKEMEAGCNGHLDCPSFQEQCPTPTECDFLRIDPYLGLARRVRVRAASTAAMKRAKPIANDLVNQPIESARIRPEFFDDGDYNVILDTATPSWIEQPPVEVIRQYAPARAVDLGMSGAAAVECTVQASGGLEACDALSAYPPNVGYDRSAVRLAKEKYRVRPVSGAAPPAAGAKVRLRIDFVNPLQIPRTVYGF